MTLKENSEFDSEFESIKDIMRLDIQRSNIPVMDYCGPAGFKIFFDQFLVDFLDLDKLKCILEDKNLSAIEDNALQVHLLDVVSEVSINEVQVDKHVKTSKDDTNEDVFSKLRHLSHCLKWDGYDEDIVADPMVWKRFVFKYRNNLIDSLVTAIKKHSVLSSAGLESSAPENSNNKPGYQSVITNSKQENPDLAEKNSKIQSHLKYTKPEDSSENLFIKVGDYFEIQYQGKLTRLKSSVGLKYLAAVLGGTSFKTLLELSQTFNPPPPGTIKSVKELPEDVNISDWNSTAPDQKALQDYEKEILRLFEERKEEKAAGFLDKVEIIDQKIKFIKDEVKKIKSQGRYSKRPPEEENARKAVSAAIHRAVKKINSENPALAAHLATALYPITDPFEYSHSAAVTWKTS